MLFPDSQVQHQAMKTNELVKLRMKRMESNKKRGQRTETHSQSIKASSFISIVVA